MFSGIGGFEVGLQNSNLEHELIGYSEMDSMPYKFLKDILKEQRIMETQLTFKEMSSLTLTSWLEDFLVRHSALLEGNEDLTIQEEHSFLTSQGFVQKKDPDIWYLKTLKVCYLMTMEKLSRQYLGFSPTWGIELNGRYLTARIGEFPKTGNESLLSDILEVSPPKKYFLSPPQKENQLQL